MTIATGAISVDEHRIDGRDGPVTVRDYRPDRTDGELTPVVWLHGGGFSNGGLDQKESDAPARAWASRGRLVRTVDYRLARRPRFGRMKGLAERPGRYPAALTDVVDAVDDLTRRGSPVVLGGASAGACLAAAATMTLRDEHETTPVALVLAYGTFHARLPVDPDVERQLHGLGRVLFSPSMVRAMNLNYVGREDLLVTGRAFPGGGDLSGFPPALLLDAENDRLRASGTAFAAELEAAGALANREVVSGTTHGFLSRPRSEGFMLAIERISAWLTTIDREDSPRD